MANLLFAFGSLICVVVPLLYGMHRMKVWRDYEDWANQNPEAHRRRVKEYIYTRRSPMEKPWG